MENTKNNVKQIVYRENSKLITATNFYKDKETTQIRCVLSFADRNNIVKLWLEPDQIQNLLWIDVHRLSFDEMKKIWEKMIWQKIVQMQVYNCDFTINEAKKGTVQ